MGSNELCEKQPCVSVRWHIILKIAFYLGKLFYSLVQRIDIKLRIQLNIVAPYFLPSSSHRIMGSVMVNRAHRVRELQVRRAKEHRCAAFQNLRLGVQPRQHSGLHLLPRTAAACCRDDTPAHSVSQCTISTGGLAMAFCISLWSFPTLCEKKNLKAWGVGAGGPSH